MPGQRILIVDDEKPVLDFATEILRREGYAVWRATSANDALPIVERERLDLLLTAQEVAGTGPESLVCQARTLNPNLSIIFMAEKAETAPATGQSVLLKPFDARDLAAVVGRSLAGQDLSSESLRLRTLLPLFEVSNAIVSEVKLERLLNLIAQVVNRETRADRVSLMLVDRSGRELTIKAAIGLPEGIMNTAVEKVGEGIAGSVAQTGKPLLLQGIVKRDDRADAGDVRSALCVPLMVRGRVIGVINSSKTSEHSPFTESDLELLSILASQAAIAIENARLFRNVEDQQARLERLLRQLLKAQEEERERISAEVHDSVAQWMVSASYYTQSADALISEQRPAEARRELENATRIIGQSVKEIRRIIADLYPPALSELGLWEALRQNIDCFERETGVSCSLDGRPPLGLSPAHEIVVYRVVQEALNNIRKHAGASQVKISLNSYEGQVSIEIHDDGKGFDVASLTGETVAPTKMGLLTMKGRAEMLGGDLNIETGEGAGTKVLLTIPLSVNRL